jgi:hypothetical protein
MDIKIDLSGMERMRRNVKELEGTRQVRLADMCDMQFMTEHTRFSSIEAMFNEADLPEGGFEAISDEDKDTMTRKLTSFGTGQEFINAAAVHYAKKQLFK